jgi:predicted protein tyrosine phosphatase
MTIIVSPLRDVDTVVRFKKPSHLITLLDPSLMSQSPRGFAPERHLRVAVDDIWEPEAGRAAPDEAMVREILDFGVGWSGAAPLLVHCWAGVSRSTATAFILACERNPNVPELTIARALRAASSGATPNPLLVSIADDLLKRQGRMSAAVRDIGHGRYVYPGQVFELPSLFPKP